MFAESIYKDETPSATPPSPPSPTGTLSIIAGVSSGVEPVFAFAFIRNMMDGTELIEVKPVLPPPLGGAGPLQ